MRRLSSSMSFFHQRMFPALRTLPAVGFAIAFIPAGPRGFLAAFGPDPVALEPVRRVDAAPGAAA